MVSCGVTLHSLSNVLASNETQNLTHSAEILPTKRVPSPRKHREFTVNKPAPSRAKKSVLVLLWHL